MADENRLRARGLLAGRELCLCQIVEIPRLAASTVSRHMSLLHYARLVESRKAGRWTYFRLADGDASAEVRDSLSLVLASLKRSEQGKADQKVLREVLRMDPEELCRRQGKCKC